MNKINFAKINTSKNKRLKITHLSTALMFVTVGVIAFVQNKQWNKLKAIKAEWNFHSKHASSFNQELEEKNKLQQEYELLSKKVSKINLVRNNPHQQFSLFTAINRALGKDTQLEALAVSKKKLDMSITCPDIKRATKFMRKVCEQPTVNSLRVRSIKPAKNGLQFTMTGALI